VLAVACAKPIVDSDLWFHLAYGRQMIERGSLVLDHTTFSWTPSDNVVIYCAWIAQLVLLALHKIGDLPLLFALRYGIFLGVILAAAWYARRTAVASHPLVWMAALLAVLMSSSAQLIKPQIFSYALMTAVVLTWACIRSGAAHAARLAYALPVLMLIWVNTHGGFVAGLAFLALAAGGEWLNARWSPDIALPIDVRRQVSIAGGLSLGATFLTPYLWRYPLQFLTIELPRIDLQAVREYDSIFAITQRGLHYVDYGVIAAGILVILFGSAWRRGRLDWSLVLPNVAFAILYASLVRMTLFWAPVVLVSVVALLPHAPAWLSLHTRRSAHVVGAAALGLAILLGGRAVRADMETPPVGSWLGFGNGYWNPEEEAEYIARHFPGARIGNDYNSGGYLIWRLWPASRVFIDARYHPYRSWFQEYLQWESTSGIGAVIEKYPADLWCVDLLLPKTVYWFRTSPDWTPAFYGASAAVFVRRGSAVPGGGLQAGEGIDGIRNLYQALVVLAFALDAGDLNGAERVVAGMERRFRTERDQQAVGNARAAVEGVRAYRQRDYPRAMALLAPIAPGYRGVAAAVLAESALLQMRRHWEAGEFGRALEMAQLAVSSAQEEPIPHYNAGVIGWWLSRQNPGAASLAWRANLERFLAMSGTRGAVSPAAVETAAAILQGRTGELPLIMVPAEPPPPDAK
jgi:hypothetical protein